MRWFILAEVMGHHGRTQPRDLWAGLSVKFSCVRHVFAIAMLLLLDSGTVCQTEHPRHSVSCLSGTVQVCSGDICFGPSQFGLDDDITVELRDKDGKTILDSTKVVPQTVVRKGTTQSGTQTTYQFAERKFRFEGKLDGGYTLAFVLHKNGTPQPAITFPTEYSHKRHKPCDSVYMLEP